MKHLGADARQRFEAKNSLARVKIDAALDGSGARKHIERAGDQEPRETREPMSKRLDWDRVKRPRYGTEAAEPKGSTAEETAAWLERLRKRDAAARDRASNTVSGRACPCCGYIVVGATRLGVPVDPRTSLG